MTVFSFTSMETLSFFSTFHVKPWLIKNIVNRLDDMLLLQDVSINDVNEIVKNSWEYFQAYLC
jgi:hypothetical protein